MLQLCVLTSCAGRCVSYLLEYVQIRGDGLDRRPETGKSHQNTELDSELQAPKALTQTAAINFGLLFPSTPAYTSYVGTVFKVRLPFFLHGWLSGLTRLLRHSSITVYRGDFYFVDRFHGCALHGGRCSACREAYTNFPDESACLTADNVRNEVVTIHRSHEVLKMVSSLHVDILSLFHVGVIQKHTLH
jgi:hypothetical protein